MLRVIRTAATLHSSVPQQPCTGILPRQARAGRTRIGGLVRGRASRLALAARLALAGGLRLADGIQVRLAHPLRKLSKGALIAVGLYHLRMDRQKVH